MYNDLSTRTSHELISVGSSVGSFVGNTTARSFRPISESEKLVSVVSPNSENKQPVGLLIVLEIPLLFFCKNQFSF